MPHPLPLLAAVAAVPLLGLALHAAPAHGVVVPVAHAASVLPNNLCASCHGGGKVATRDNALDARDLMAFRSRLQGMPQG